MGGRSTLAASAGLSRVGVNLVSPERETRGEQASTVKITVSPKASKIPKVIILVQFKRSILSYEYYVSVPES